VLGAAVETLRCPPTATHPSPLRVPCMFSPTPPPPSLLFLAESFYVTCGSHRGYRYHTPSPDLLSQFAVSVSLHAICGVGPTAGVSANGVQDARNKFGGIRTWMTFAPRCECLSLRVPVFLSACACECMTRLHTVHIPPFIHPVGDPRICHVLLAVAGLAGYSVVAHPVKGDG
jgi:hypothetical protein